MLNIKNTLFGDLIQSFFKRKNNIKDSSNFLPGHGGFFDRFDSFISSIIFLPSEIGIMVWKWMYDNRSIR